MASYDSRDLWLDVSEEEQQQRDTEDSNKFSFEFDLDYKDEDGDYHVRNKNNEKQRVYASSYRSGRKKTPFDFTCKTRAVIHGTLSQGGKLATLLVYDFSFISLRSATRIKEVSLRFKFQAPGDGQPGEDPPMVAQVRPIGTNTTLKTSEGLEYTYGAGVGASGGSGISAELSGNIAKTVKKEVTHATEIRGHVPVDNFGDTYEAEWVLCENASQKSGVAALVRTCILLERKDDNPFDGCPDIQATANFTTMVKELFSMRPKDEPIHYDPSLKPYNTLEGRYSGIDRWNLGDVDLDSLWKCTFHKEFGAAVEGAPKS